MQLVFAMVGLAVKMVHVFPVASGCVRVMLCCAVLSHYCTVFVCVVLGLMILDLFPTGVHV